MISPFVTENDNTIFGIDNNIVIIGLLILSIIYLISLNNESFKILKKKNKNENFTTDNTPDENNTPSMFDTLKNKLIDTHTAIRDVTTSIITQGSTEPLTGEKVLENVTTTAITTQKNAVNGAVDTVTDFANMIKSYVN
jgi:hypothetical protein